MWKCVLKVESSTALGEDAGRGHSPLAVVAVAEAKHAGY